jgi:hypothetical protein
MEGQVVPKPVQSDGSISLILDEGIAFASDLPCRTWGANPMHQVENELADASGMARRYIHRRWNSA